MYIVSLYLCIWGGGLCFYLCIWRGRGLGFFLGFYLQYMGISFFRPGRPPCKLACRLLCKLTLSGYGISYRRRRKGDRGALGLGRAVANPYRRLVFEIQNEWLIFELNGAAFKFWRFTNFLVSILTIYVGLIVIFSVIFFENFVKILYFFLKILGKFWEKL